MVAGADSIEDMDLLRHGGMGRLFTGMYAPSTLGSFLRSFTFGHVRQLDAVAARLVANLARHTPLLPDAGQIAYLDIDDTIRATYGYAKQGAGYGYSGVKGLNALLAALSTPSSGAGDHRDPAAQGLGELRPRRGPPGRRRPQATSRGVRGGRAAGGAGGLGVLRPRRRRRDRPGEGPVLHHRPQDVAVRRAIAAIGEDAWTTIRYPRAVFDDQLGQWVSDAAGRRGAVHRVRLPRQETRSHRAADRAPRPRPEPRPPRRQRAGGAVRGLAPPRRVHRTRPWCWCRPRPTTAATPSSNRSSPT